MYFGQATHEYPAVMTLQLPDGIVVPMDYGDRVRVEKWLLPQLPREYRPSLLSLSLGARAVYRDGNSQDSLQVRDHGAYWEFELDRFNPEAGPVEFVAHGVVDAPHVALAVLASVVVACHLGG